MRNVNKQKSGHLLSFLGDQRARRAHTQHTHTHTCTHAHKDTDNGELWEVVEVVLVVESLNVLPNHLEVVTQLSAVQWSGREQDDEPAKGAAKGAASIAEEGGATDLMWSMSTGSCLCSSSSLVHSVTRCSNVSLWSSVLRASCTV